MGKAYLLSAAPPRGGRSSTWKEQWGDPWRGTLLSYQPRVADHIHPDQKHWGFPLLPFQAFLPRTVSLHQAEIKGDSGAVLLPQGTGTSLCCWEHKAARFSPFSHCFLHGYWDPAMLSAPKRREPLLIRGRILRGLQGKDEVPVSTISTAAPGAITRQGSYKRHKDQFFLFQRCKPRIKDTYPCLDRKLAMQSKEVPTDIKFSFFPTPLLLWGARLSQSRDGFSFWLSWQPTSGKAHKH